jgi:uracil-DNA glycosylase
MDKAHTSLEKLRAEARNCRACGLWKPATQTVFGAGPADAAAIIIGEVPGDREDIEGQPFVGPAGRLLDRALKETGVDRSRVYVTNMVKHFKFEPRGKRRMHQRPDSAEQAACRPWLTAEIELIKPKFLLCLGAMAAHAILGSNFKLMKERGQWRSLPNRMQAMATVHPSYLLRLPGEEARIEGYRDFVGDLKVFAEALSERR